MLVALSGIFLLGNIGGALVNLSKAGIGCAVATAGGTLGGFKFYHLYFDAEKLKEDFVDFYQCVDDVIEHASCTKYTTN